MVDGVSFREVQYFRQPWLLVLLAVDVLVNVWAMVQQIVLGQPWGDNPASNGVLLIIFLLAGVLLPLFILSAHLRIEVRREGFVYRFFPFQFRDRTIAWKDISSHRKVRYSPFRDYGGWGIRYGRQGMAFNVGGNQGVVLTLGEGREVLFGSKEPESLDLAIGSMLI